MGPVNFPQISPGISTQSPITPGNGDLSSNMTAEPNPPPSTETLSPIDPSPVKLEAWFPNGAAVSTASEDAEQRRLIVSCRHLMRH